MKKRCNPRPTLKSKRGAPSVSLYFPKTYRSDILATAGMSTASDTGPPTIGLTYDALGRSIEIAYPSELFYFPDGSQVLFKGQVARGGIFRLPGGAQVNYDSTQGGLISYSHADHLGSLRLTSTPARGFVSSLAYAPFGEEYATSNPNAGGNAAFTGWGSGFAFDEFDFPLRQYSNQGRWPNPDPLGRTATCPKDPQTQNRYAYVRNNPLSYTDPTGGMLCLQCTGGGGGCEPDDPYCFICDPADPLCGPLLGVTFIGIGGPSVKKRKFPWPQLPAAFFVALEEGGGSSANPERKQCAKDCLKDFLYCSGACLILTLPFGEIPDPLWSAVATCVGACAATGPGWPECAATCVEGGLLVEDAIWKACFAGAIGVFVACELTTPSPQSGFTQ